MRHLDFLGGKKSRAEYRRDARRNWPWLRILLSDINVSYTEAKDMDPDDVYMLNEAIDIAAEQREKKINKK